MAHNPNLTPAARQLFTSMIAQSGMPVTAADMQTAWNRCNAAQGSQFTNDSQWSPFWRLISAMITKPAQWLVGLLVEHALPNTFLRFAGDVWLDVFAFGVDVTRKGSAPARGRLEFSRMAESTTGGAEIKIPAGTLVQSPPLGDSGTVYRVRTLADAIIPAGEQSALIEVEAEAHGEAYNLGPGYYAILVKALSGVGSVRNLPDWLESPGADVEQDDALRLRCRNQFAAVGQYHHDAAYRALMADFAGIRVDHIFFEKEAPRGPGTANAHIMIESGTPPAELIEALNTHIRESGNHGHGDDMRCMAIQEMPIALAVTVYPVAGLDAKKAEELRKGVEDRVRCAFRENTDFPMTRVLPLSRFSFSRLAEELHSQLPDLQSVEFGWFSSGDAVGAVAPDSEGGVSGECTSPDMMYAAIAVKDIVSLRQLPVLKEFSVILRGAA